VADDSWKRPPGGFRYRHNTPAGHIERAVAAVRHQGVGKIALVVACAAALLMIALR
jgi:hypothetical protein